MFVLQSQPYIDLMGRGQGLSQSLNKELVVGYTNFAQSLLHICQEGICQDNSQRTHILEFSIHIASYSSVNSLLLLEMVNMLQMLITSLFLW